MKKKFLGRVLTMLLVASMVFTLLPAPAIAAGNWWWNNEAAESLADTTDSILPHRIIHLDCGRKYFSVGNVKSLIDVMAAYGYNELELAFGNDGLRFLLGDMSISFTTENGTTSYTDKDIRDAVVEGNENQNSSGDGSYWTEADMTKILDYASSKNIEIVPLLNMPGHMKALLDGEKFHQYRISGNDKNYSEQTSKDSIDPANSDAVAFGLAILQKYVNWFEAYNNSHPDGKVKYFNFGADEVGNDIVNPFYGYNYGYSSCAEYINKCAAIIKNAGMTPRAFNDLLYYGSNYTTGVDKSVQVCYWSDQWSGSPYITARSMKEQGHQMINTNSEWYYVLGVKENNLSYALNSVDKYEYNDFYERSGNSVVASRIADTAGVMLCIWCDNPNAAKPEAAIAEATQLFAKFAEKNSAVFPAKGEIPPTPQPEPTEPTTEHIYVTVGQPYTVTIDGNHLGSYEGIDTSIATVTGEVISGSTTTTQKRGDMYDVYYYNGYQSATGVISDGKGNYLKISNDNASCVNTNDITEATRFKFTRIKSSEKSNTIQIDDRRSNYDTFYLEKSGSNVAVSATNATWIVGTGSNFCIKRSNGYDYDCLVFADGNWKCALNDWSHAGYLYEVKPDTTSTADKTELTFTGVKPGNTEVTIGTTKYLIHVSEAQLSDNRICINYYITNHKVEDENGNTSRWVSANEAGINSEKGVAIEDLIALTGTDTFTKKPAKFYKATAQSGNNIQTDAGWTNKIAAGDNCAKLRYWNNTWSVCDASGLWHEVSGKTAEYNPDTQREASAYGKNDGYAAITAYYGQRTDVTDEITTYATDWGEDITTSQSNKNIKPLGDTYALLDFAVKYQTGDRTPTQFTNAKTIVYNAVGNDDYQYSQDGNTRIVKDLFVENSDGYEVYMITVTKCSEKLTTDARNLDALPAVTYAEENEKVVWVDKEADLGDFAPTDKHYPGYKEGGEPIVPAVYVAKSNAYLVTYYVRAVSKDQLQVNYIDLATNKPFYHYGINVRGTTTFSEDIALNRDTADSWKGDLVNGTVTNDKNKNQTVSADLSTMPEIGAEYRHVAYTCDHIQLSADRKTLDLYYKFNNTVTFVADFGLPITINKGDLSETLNNAGVEITEVKAAGVNHGAVEINEDVVTYTPDKRFVADENGESFTLTYTGTNVQETGSEGKVAYRVNILPASNVLYEENFLTQSGESGRTGWTEYPFDTAQQQTQKLKEQQTFGYDIAYANVTSAQGYWTADSLMTKADSTKSLTTDFYGNAIDVIGSCGPKTGIVMVSIKNATTGKPVKSVVIETTYTAGTIDQVPLAHIELGEGNANYTAIIRGYAPINAAQQQSGSLMLAADYYGGSYDALAADLAEMGLSLSDVEFIRASGAAAKTASTRRAAQSYALETVAEGRNSDNTVTIDGFRVYRSANNEAYKKLINEYQVTYCNILKVMEGKVITAYVDNGAVTDCNVSEYEKLGGPQNEIYLQKNQVIAFKLFKDGSAAANQEIQISLSAVSGTTQYNKTNNISSTMEMYYTLTTDENGIVSITNTGDNLLAIGNVKVPAGCTTIAPNGIDTQELVRSINLALNAAPETPDVGFDPAISAKVTTTRFIRSKVVTLTVSASSDVAVLKVNGVELRPTNSWLVKMGWIDTYTYILTEKVQKSEIKTYEIVGYRADGAASETFVVKSK